MQSFVEIIFFDVDRKTVVSSCLFVARTTKNSYQNVGAMKQGRGTCSTFKAFNLTYLHILCSQVPRSVLVCSRHVHVPQSCNVMCFLTCTSLHIIRSSYSSFKKVLYLRDLNKYIHTYECTDIPLSSTRTWTLSPPPIFVNIRLCFYFIAFVDILSDSFRMF